MNERSRISEAYLRMAIEANYRPAAPSYGDTHIQLSKEELANPQQLEKEAKAYAAQFIKEENTRSFRIGISDYSMNRALVYTVEAARLMCRGHIGNICAARLLKLALDDLTVVQPDSEPAT